MQVIKICEGRAMEDGCLSKDFRGGDVVYLETQAEKDKDSAKKYYDYNCLNFNTSGIQNLSSVYITNSGFSVITYYNGTHKKFPIFLLDINGLQGPNKWGYDIFVFQFSKKRKYDSVFFLDYDARCHSLDKGGYYTKTFMQYLYGQNSDVFYSSDTGLNIPK